MERYQEAAQYAIETLKRSGADEAECFVRCDGVTEVNVDSGDFSLMRTYGVNSLVLSGLKNKRPCRIRTSRIDKAAIDDAIAACNAGMSTAKVDETRSVAELTQNGSFAKGPLECDYDRFLYRVAEYAEYYQTEENEPLNEYIVSHVHSKAAYCNTNGVEFSSDQGWYQAGGRSGSIFAPDMSRPLSEVGKVDEPYDKSLRKQEVKPLGGKFEGTLVYHPHLVRLEWWLSMFVLFNDAETLGEEGNKKNKWMDKLGEMVASPCYSYSNMPLYEYFCGSPFFTADGYRAKNVDFIKDGKLVNLPINRRASRKLGLSATMPTVDYETEEVIKCNTFVKPGEQSIKDIIKGIKRGIIVKSLPGCVPHMPEVGDMNSVIHGGLLIEDGVVTRPVSEVMVAGNYYEKFKNVHAVSSEYRASGGDICPWVAYDGFIMQ